MPAAAQVLDQTPLVAPTIRRFQLADLVTHGHWIVPRLCTIYKHLSEPQLGGFLKGLIYDNESMFLYQENSVALAQVVRSHTLAPEPVIWERFVLARDEKFVKEAAEFYTEFQRWARHHDSHAIVVEQQTDVPHDLIKERLGRLMETKQVFARV